MTDKIIKPEPLNLKLQLSLKRKTLRILEDRLLDAVAGGNCAETQPTSGEVLETDSGPQYQ